MNNIILQERDYLVFNCIMRFRFLLGRQIKILGGFPSQRTTDRRLKKLIEARYIEKRHIFYGIPSLYFITLKAKRNFNLKFYTPNVRVENIIHDIFVVDTAIYFIGNFEIQLDDITTERELKNLDGFGTSKHHPDFIFTKDTKTNCIEVELSEKKIAKLEENVKRNYKNFDTQYWIVFDSSISILNNLAKLRKRYSNIAVISLDIVKNYVDQL